MTKILDVTVPDDVKGYSQVRLDVDLSSGKIEKSTLSGEF